MNGAHLRTLIVAAGLGFAGVALGSACLDYAGEDWGACSAAPQGSTGAGSGVGSARLGAGSGSGVGAPVTVPTSDCGTGALPEAGAATP